MRTLDQWNKWDVKEQFYSITGLLSTFKNLSIILHLGPIFYSLIKSGVECSSNKKEDKKLLEK